jgi:lipopolysaccharide/colanic/teichoic acid biosynthesis glycosyltransferase
VRPGLTGLWQVSGRNNLTYRTRVRLDLTYVRHRNFWLDLGIVLRTIGVVLLPMDRGAY